MLDAKAREALSGLSNATGRVLARAHLTPNVITSLGLALTAVAGWAIVDGRFFLGGLLLVFGGVLDFCDGAVAKATGRTTRFGAFYDSVSDRISDSAVYGALVWLYFQRGDDRTAVVALVGLLLALLTSYIRAKADAIGFDAHTGILERAERLIGLMAGLLLGIMEPILWILAAGGAVTVIQRLVSVYRQGRAEVRN